MERSKDAGTRTEAYLIESTYYSYYYHHRYGSIQRASFIKPCGTEGVNLIRPNDPASVFRDAPEAGATRAAMQIAGVAGTVCLEAFPQLPGD